MTDPWRAKKVGFVFTGGRKARLAGIQEFPDDFFYGYTRYAGAKKLIEINEFKPWQGGLAALALEKLFLSWHISYGLCRTILAHQDEFADLDAIVLTTNSHSDHFSFLKSLGYFSRPALYSIPMGLYARRLPWLARRLWPVFYRRTTLLPISRSEEALLKEKLPRSGVHYLPFGVDVDFWTGAAAGASGDYVLSIGNDPQRDYATLLAAWRPDFPWLKIITSLPLPGPLPDNVEVIAGDWRQNLLTDQDIREYYRGARLVIIPLHDSLQPSGQSAALQAMACGKAVILTRTSGLWDAESMVHGEVCYLVEAGRPQALADAVALLWHNPQETARLGANARRLVLSRFNSENFARRLEAALRPGRQD
jgi:glycosyltransferase involved in cell wall biosynthesis